MKNDLLNPDVIVFSMRSDVSVYKENSSTFYDIEMARKCTIPITPNELTFDKSNNVQNDI